MQYSMLFGVFPFQRRSANTKHGGDSEVFAPDIDPEVYWPCALLKSVHNTVIEAFWRWLREKTGINMKTHILRGKEEHIFNPNVPLHTSVYSESMIRSA